MFAMFKKGAEMQKGSIFATKILDWMGRGVQKTARQLAMLMLVFCTAVPKLARVWHLPDKILANGTIDVKIFPKMGCCCQKILTIGTHVVRKFSRTALKIDKICKINILCFLRRRFKRQLNLLKSSLRRRIKRQFNNIKYFFFFLRLKAGLFSTTKSRKLLCRPFVPNSAQARPTFAQALPISARLCQVLHASCQKLHRVPCKFLHAVCQKVHNPGAFGQFRVISLVRFSLFVCCFLRCYNCPHCLDPCREP